MQTSDQRPSTSTLTSRERVQKALNHEEADRVPIDLGAMPSTGIMAIAYARLKDYLGMKGGQIRVYDIRQQLAEVELEVLDRFDADVIPLEHTLGEKQTGQWQPWHLPDGTACQVPASIDLRFDDAQGDWLVYENGVATQRMSPDSLYFTQVFHPLAGVSTNESPEQFPVTLLSDEELVWLNQKAKSLCENTDFAIMANFGGNILETGICLRGWGQFMEDMAIGGAFTEDLIETIVETQLQNLDRYLEAVGDYVQIIEFYDDMGSQDRALFSKRMYQRWLKPGHQKLFDYVHQHSDCAVFLHSCGSIYQLIPDLIEAGVDILNPVQTSAANVDPHQLKAEFGDKITFWGGGCDTQQFLPNATPEQVYDHVTERINIFAPGGGYVFNPIHNIQANIPPEQITAMYAAASRFRYGN